MVIWDKDGVCGVDQEIIDPFDQVDVLSKSAQIYINAKCMGFEPDGMTPEQMKELSVTFNLPK